jgi:hypothetical protein
LTPFAASSYAQTVSATLGDRAGEVIDDTAVVGEPRYEECRQRNPEWWVRELDNCVTADLEVSLDGRELRS